MALLLIGTEELSIDPVLNCFDVPNGCEVIRVISNVSFLSFGFVDSSTATLFGIFSSAFMMGFPAAFALVEPSILRIGHLSSPPSCASCATIDGEYGCPCVTS